MNAKTFLFISIGLLMLACSEKNMPDSTSSKEGTLSGLFTVSENRRVYFSKGNLQYNASLNIWRFAENQNDSIGYANQNISSSYEGWIDLFGWGTSGWNSGAYAYQPWSIISNYDYYYVGGNSNNDLTGAYSKSDWGVYNKISNGGNQSNLWRVLTSEEWVYLIEKRDKSDLLCGQATVNGKRGLVILPNEWELPNGLHWVGMPYDWVTNQYDEQEWKEMEENGAVFLPFTGLREGTKMVEDFKNAGMYWSSTHRNEKIAFIMDFGIQGIIAPRDFCNRSSGCAVRLVKDY